MDYAQGYRDGFAAGVAAAQTFPSLNPVLSPNPGGMVQFEQKEPKKRKVSAYSRAYGRAYKALRRKHTLKSGKLRKGITHKRLVKMAHAEAKRGRKK